MKAQQAMYDAWRGDVMHKDSPEEHDILDLITQLNVPAPECPKLYNSTRYLFQTEGTMAMDKIT